MRQLDLIVGVLELGLAFVVLRYLGRFGRTFPWLVALMVFALARAADRIYTAASGHEALATSLVTDLLTVATLVLLIAGLRLTVHGLQTASDEASGRTAEYERALHDYRVVLRHRIANRIAAIRGGAETLGQRPDLPAAERIALLQLIADESRELEAEALDDRLYEIDQRRPEERGLRPKPHRRYRTDVAAWRSPKST